MTMNLNNLWRDFLVNGATVDEVVAGVVTRATIVLVHASTSIAAMVERQQSPGRIVRVRPDAFLVDRDRSRERQTGWPPDLFETIDLDVVDENDGIERTFTMWCPMRERPPSPLARTVGTRFPWHVECEMSPQLATLPLMAANNTAGLRSVPRPAHNFVGTMVGPPVIVRAVVVGALKIPPTGRRAVSTVMLAPTVFDFDRGAGGVEGDRARRWFE